jgi:hypothetical protein
MRWRESGDDLDCERQQEGGETLIHVSDPARLSELARFLARDQAAQVSTTGPCELEVWWVDSRNAWAQQMELERRLRAWMAAHEDVIVTLLS